MWLKDCAFEENFAKDTNQRPWVLRTYRWCSVMSNIFILKRFRGSVQQVCLLTSPCIMCRSFHFSFKALEIISFYCIACFKIFFFIMLMVLGMFYIIWRYTITSWWLKLFYLFIVLLPKQLHCESKASSILALYMLFFIILSENIELDFNRNKNTTYRNVQICIWGLCLCFWNKTVLYKLSLEFLR